jgi:hypothetical protein
MREAKRSRKREPFSSNITDERREYLVRQVEHRDATPEETKELLGEYVRAQNKIALANIQIADPSPFELSSRRFDNPDYSRASASATSVLAFWPLSESLTSGAKARRAQKKAGIGRHHADNDPETAARYAEWSKAAIAIVSEMRAERRGNPRQRQLALLIASRVPGSNPETVRGWLKREQRKGNVFWR